MPWAVIGIVLLVLLVAILLVTLYNRLVRLRNRAEGAAPGSDSKGWPETAPARR